MTAEVIDAGAGIAAGDSQRTGGLRFDDFVEGRRDSPGETHRVSVKEKLSRHSFPQ